MILTQPIAFVDIETTGLDTEIHEIIELGVVIAKMKDGIFTVTDKLDVKIQPKHIENADPVALRVNGYNEGDWLFGTSIEEALKSFVEKTDGAIFTAHNMAFDYGFIEANLKRYNIPHTMHYHKLDTISVAFGVLQNQNDDMGKYSLRVLCEKYGIINPHAHSAYADAYATYEVFKKLLNLK
jgi:DNA polymerase III alpha subunit (gram-positive type)